VDQEILELLLNLERQLLLHLGGDGLNRGLCRLLTMLVNANSAAAPLLQVVSGSFAGDLQQGGVECDFSRGVDLVLSLGE